MYVCMYVCLYAHTNIHVCMCLYMGTPLYGVPLVSLHLGLNLKPLCGFAGMCLISSMLVQILLVIHCLVSSCIHVYRLSIMLLFIDRVCVYKQCLCL